jgi:hypothetical protein
MFISSLHNIKSKNFKKRTLEKDERNLLYFKMEWRMKVGIEWRPSMAGQPKIGGRPATFSLMSSFPLHYLPL